MSEVEVQVDRVEEGIRDFERSLGHLQQTAIEGWKVLSKSLGLLDRLREVKELHTDTNHLYFTQTSGKLLLEVSLSEDKKDSTLVRTLAKTLGITFRKEKAWEGAETLKAVGENDKIKITVQGYLPASCQLIEEEVEVPAHTEKRYRIDCGPNNEGSNG